MFDIVGLGENSIDEVYRLPAMPQPGTGAAKIRIREHTIFAGGQVATTMVACAALGLRAKYIGVFGNDDGGRLVRRELDGRGVDTSGSIIREIANRRAVIMVDESHGERVVLWERDDGLNIAPGEVRPEWFADARALHVDAVDAPAALAAARLARAAGLEVTSDIEDVSGVTDALVAAVTVPIFAEHATTALTGERDPEQALRALRRRHAGLLCVTLGDRGALLLEGDRLHHQPAFAVDAVDSTSAGDVFRAGVLYGVLARMPAAELLRFACAAAAVACTRPGAMASVPSLDEVQRLMDSGGVRS